MQEIKVSNEWIPFVDMTKDFGRAEFSICTHYKRGKLIKAWLFPLQQEDRSKFWVWEGKANGLMLTGYGLENPKVWLTGWCKEHKCQTLRFYVPPDSKFIHLHQSVGSLCVDFHLKKYNI